MSDPVERQHPSNPNWLVPETAQFNLEDLKAASRGTWPIADMIAAEQQRDLTILRNRLDSNTE